jgi:hypothetical protein
MNLHKPTRIAKSVKNQAPLSAVLFPLRHPRDELVGQRRDPLLESSAQIEPQQLSHVDHKSHRVEPPRVVRLHVPLQVPRLGPEPPQHHHRHNPLFSAQNPLIARSRTLRSPAPHGTAVVRAGQELAKMIGRNRWVTGPGKRERREGIGIRRDRRE